MKVLVAQSCLTLCGPLDCSPPGSSAHGISQTRILEWIVISFSRGSSQTKYLPCSPPLAGELLPLSREGCPQEKFVVVQTLLCDSWTAACQASLSFTITQSLLKLTPIESVMPSNYIIICHCLLLLPSTFPSIRVFSNESALCIR